MNTINGTATNYVWNKRTCGRVDSDFSGCVFTTLRLRRRAKCTSAVIVLIARLRLDRYRHHLNENRYLLAQDKSLLRLWPRYQKPERPFVEAYPLERAGNKK